MHRRTSAHVVIAESTRYSQYTGSSTLTQHQQVASVATSPAAVTASPTHTSTECPPTQHSTVRSALHLQAAQVSGAESLQRAAPHTRARQSSQPCNANRNAGTPAMVSNVNSAAAFQRRPRAALPAALPPTPPAPPRRCPQRLPAAYASRLRRADAAGRFAPVARGCQRAPPPLPSCSLRHAARQSEAGRGSRMAASLPARQCQ